MTIQLAKSTPLDVMLDLETMGTRPGAPILQIGAVRFDRHAETFEPIGETFHIRIELASCIAVGLKPDADTILWWMKQDDSARDSLAQPGIHISHANSQFRHWLGDGNDYMWANGASFDFPIYASAERATGCFELPWNFWNERCYRTIKGLAKTAGHAELPFDGTKHDALADAMHQARNLVRFTQLLKI